MSEFLCRENIKYLNAQLALGNDETRKATIRQVILHEKQKLARILAGLE